MSMMSVELTIVVNLAVKCYNYFPLTLEYDILDHFKYQYLVITTKGYKHYKILQSTDHYTTLKNSRVLNDRTGSLHRSRT